jgi:hypothetical protein
MPLVRGGSIVALAVEEEMDALNKQRNVLSLLPCAVDLRRGMLYFRIPMRRIGELSHRAAACPLLRGTPSGGLNSLSVAIHRRTLGRSARRARHGGVG